MLIMTLLQFWRIWGFVGLLTNAKIGSNCLTLRNMPINPSYCNWQSYYYRRNKYHVVGTLSTSALNHAFLSHSISYKPRVMPCKVRDTDKKQQTDRDNRGEESSKDKLEFLSGPGVRTWCFRWMLQDWGRAGTLLITKTKLELKIK